MLILHSFTENFITQVLLECFIIENNVVPMLPDAPNSEKEGGFPRGMVSEFLCIKLSISGDPLVKIATEKR